jgi:hypothetical protein
MAWPPTDIKFVAVAPQSIPRTVRRADWPRAGHLDQLEQIAVSCDTRLFGAAAGG